MPTSSTPRGVFGRAVLALGLLLVQAPLPAQDLPTATKAAIDRIRAELSALEARLPVDCVQSPFVLADSQPWGACRADNTQTRAETWTRDILTPAANGGLACGEPLQERTGVQACVYVPPAPPPSGQHGYFDSLVARPDHWKSYSLRSAAMLDQYRWGWLKAQTYDPANDPYPQKQDAAKITVNPFIPQRRPDNNQFVTLSQPMDATTDVLQADWMAHGNGITYRIDNEILSFVAKLTDPVTGRVSTRVSRGAHGTTPATHAAGVEVWRSTNATVSQIRLPMGTERGRTYLVTWDSWYGKETRFDQSGILGWKNYQFGQGTGDGTLGLEVRSRMVESSSVVLAPDEVATADMRAYLALGAGIGNEPISPRQEFRIKAATWTRYWVLLDHTLGDWDYLTLWMADVNRAPVKLLDRIPYRPGSRTFAKFWLEFSSSNETLKPGRGPLVAYVRNVWMGRDVADPASILVQPK